MRKTFYVIAALICTGIVAQAESPLVRQDLDRLSIDFELADGAAWDGRGTLYVPDVKAKKLIAIQTNTPELKSKTRIEGSHAISGTCFQRGKLYFLDNPGCTLHALRAGGKPTEIARFGEGERPNDLVVDRDGTAYITFTKQGEVRRVDANGEVTTIATGIAKPNGIAISPDQSTLYVSSFSTGEIIRLQPSPSQSWTKSSFAQLPETQDGFRGDGMTTDRAGNLYTTGAASVIVWSPSGKKIDQIVTPERPINVVIGGRSARDLFISTFGGVYRKTINQYAVIPHPDAKGGNEGPTSTNIPDDLKAEFDVVFAEIGDRRLLMDVIKHRDNQNRPLIVLVHGGGWLNGDKKKFRPLSIRLAERGYVVASIEYRLGHEAKFPAGIRDCNAATAFLRANADRYGIDADRIYAVGGSAGGHLVGLMAAGDEIAELKHADFLPDTPSHLNAAVVMAGPLQMTTGSVAARSQDADSGSNAYHWLGGTIGDLPELYELADAHLKVDATMPPTLFISGSKDSPQRNELTRQIIKSMGRDARLVVHEGATHGHWNRPDWIEKVADDIDSFLKSTL